MLNQRLLSSFSMIELTPLQIQDLPKIIEMESAEDTSKFIMAYSQEQHQVEMNKPNIKYLTITKQNIICGFIILATDNNFQDVEFRRIVVDAKGEGIGQLAIAAMETYCLKQFNTLRVWLDVFEANTRGQHIYQKLGYNVFKSENLNSNTLLYMDKTF